MKKRLPGIFSLLLTVAAYFIIRYPLFDLHGMKQWPMCLMIAAGVIILVAGVIMGIRALPVLTAIGYVGGFIVGKIFETDSGMLNNLWIIWTVCLAVTVVIGCILASIARKSKKRKEEKEREKLQKQIHERESSESKEHTEQ